MTGRRRVLVAAGLGRLLAGMGLGDASRSAGSHAAGTRALTRRSGGPRGVSAELRLASFGKSARLPEGESVPGEFLPRQRGEHEFACQMGMIRGRILV